MADGAAINGNPSMDPNVEALKANATAAYNSVANGPVAQNVVDQSQKTTAELGNLAAARHPPDYSTATGQRLTNYHSFFSELLSWRNPRASAITYATLVTLIFSVRYLDVLRWGFKLTWMVLGITLAAEIAGKALLNNGFATQLRPRQYYTVPKETLNTVVGDVHELINFFVIEAQRVLFAENLYASAAAAFAAFVSYYLVKVVPYWGLAVIATTVVFFTPLIYTTNQELIDSQLKHATEVVGAQTAQLRTVAQKHTEQATQVTKQYVGDYTAKAQALMGTARRQGEQLQHQAGIKTEELQKKAGINSEELQKKAGIKSDDFPAAPRADIPGPDFPVVPKEDFKSTEPLLDGGLERSDRADEDPLITA